MTGHAEPWNLDMSEAAQELSDAWDEAVRGDLAFEAAGTGDLIGAVRGLHAVDTAPHLSSWQRDQIWDDIVARHASGVFLVGPLPAASATLDALDGQRLANRPIQSAHPSRSVTGRWALAQLATAALLLLTLLAGFAALRVFPYRGGDERAIGIPAPESPSDVLAPELGDNTILLQGMFDEIPSLASWVGMERISLAPGAEWTRGRNQDLGEGPLLFGVESGALTIEANGPVAVIRQDGTPTTIAPGEDVTLNPGDRGFAASGIVAQWRNTGTVPVSVIDAGITTSGTGWGRIPGAVTYEQLVAEYQFKAQALPLAMTVHRVTLKPGENLATDTIPGLEMLWVESGNLVALDHTEAETSVAPFAFDKGTKEAGNLRTGRVFQSADDKPVTLLVMTITPADSTLTTPAP
jgi:hypothetical protein